MLKQRCATFERLVLYSQTGKDDGAIGWELSTRNSNHYMTSMNKKGTTSVWN